MKSVQRMIEKDKSIEKKEQYWSMRLSGNFEEISIEDERE